MNIKNAWKHFRTIQKHRKWVRHYCFGLGLYWQGLTHDLSKYSPVEFRESTRFYVGTSSPIDEAKAAQGYSMSWFHHRGRNKHHWEYWMDNFSDGGINVIMPYKYFAEMICDYLGAARAYRGNQFSFTDEYNWWLNKRTHTAMNPKLVVAVDRIFADLMWWESRGGNPEDLLFSGSFVYKAYTDHVYGEVTAND
jgi:hypothetical protein